MSNTCFQTGSFQSVAKMILRDPHYRVRFIFHGHADRECKFTIYACRHMDNGVVCGSSKHHQQLHGPKNRWVKLINSSTVRQSIDEPYEKIEFGMDEMLLQVQLVPFRGGTNGIVTIVLIRHQFAKKLGLNWQEVIQRIQVSVR